MRKIGRKVYFNKHTGDVLFDTGEAMGFVMETTYEQDYVNGELHRYPESDIDVAKFEYGDYADVFALGEFAFFKINPKTKSMEFFNKEIYRMRTYNEQDFRVDYTPEKIHEFFDAYINVNIKNALKLGHVKFVWRTLDELNIRPTILDKSWVNYFKDDYLIESARNKMALAESILKNGTYWTIVTAYDEEGVLQVYEGNHRVISAKLAMMAGKWDKDKKFLTMELQKLYPSYKVPHNQRPLDTPLTQVYPTASYFKQNFYESEEAKAEVEAEMADQGMSYYDEDGEIVQRQIYTYTEFMYSNQIFPHWLRDILYKYKQETGEDFPTPTIFNDEQAWSEFIKEAQQDV